MHDVDVAIVGGGPAGLSTALHLQAAAPGVKLVVLEAETYPREKICAGGIGGRGLRILERLGLDVGCPIVPLDVLAVKVGSHTLVTREPGLGGVVRRIEFDHALATQAIARAIDVRDGCEVTSIAVDADAVRLTTAQREYRARVVVGADGVGGIVRRATGFPRGELRAQVVELDTEAAPDDQPRDTITFDFTARDLRGYTWDFPTLVAGAPLVCRGAYVLHAGAHESPRTRIARYLADRGLDLRRYRLKQFAERGFEPGAPIARPRVLLVGEAAGIDIATGEGIAQSLEYGSLAGPYLARALAADDVGFADWQRTVARRHLGKQLRVRHACYRLFYGQRRDTVERILPRISALVRIGVRDFAGKPMSKLQLLHGAGQALAAYVKENARD
ncbi:MAG: NAD(P)/FAD-dependent oxidoreductase [Acidobacteriota bacterium]